LISSKERIEALLRRSEELINESKFTDYRMSIILPFIPAVLSSVGLLLMIVGFVGTLIHTALFILLITGLVLFVAGMLVNFYVVYKWID
jgi:hypothetical protein